MSEFTYKAYISYSHRDERWAKWLHRAIESYRVPRKLVGTETDAGLVPARVKPVFRDRDDLSSATDLAVTVKQALNQSENLIVVCSPSAAASRWVNEEIREFIRLGREKRIYCIIVDGEAVADGSVSACLPGALAEAGLNEPLAADIRKWADGKHLARLKLVAGMLGLPLDKLRQRDLQRRQRTWALAALASIALVAIMITAITARISAQQRRDSGESLVAYKLTELRTMLKVANDPAELMGLAQWDSDTLAELIAAAGSGDNAFTDSAMVLREKGQALWRAGAFKEAMVSFQQSWVLLAEEFRLNRDDPLAFFEIGQADYWIGRVHQDQGDLESAEEAFMSYAEITRQLILMQPENAEWVLEMSYALTNLGGLEQARAENNPDRTLQFMQSALEYNQIALVLDPKNNTYRSELSQSHINLADAQRNVCDLDGAQQTLSESIALESALLQDDQQNAKRRRYLAHTLNGYANVRNQQGYVGESLEHLYKSLKLAEADSVQGSNSMSLLRINLRRKLFIARLLAMQGKIDEARNFLGPADSDWKSFRKNQKPGDTRMTLIFLDYVQFRSFLAQASGDLQSAEQLLLSALNGLEGVLSDIPGHRRAGNTLALATFQYWELKQELPEATYLSLLPEYSIGSGSVRACRDADAAMRKAIMLGDLKQASEFTAYLQNHGYRETFFLRICKAYNVCD